MIMTSSICTLASSMPLKKRGRTFFSLFWTLLKILLVAKWLSLSLSHFIDIFPPTISSIFTFISTRTYSFALTFHRNVNIKFSLTFFFLFSSSSSFPSTPLSSSIASYKSYSFYVCTQLTLQCQSIFAREKNQLSIWQCLQWNIHLRWDKIR